MHTQKSAKRKVLTAVILCALIACAVVVVILIVRNRGETVIVDDSGLYRPEETYDDFDESLYVDWSKEGAEPFLRNKDAEKDRMAEELAEKINAYRQENGLDLLLYSPPLQECADIRAQEIYSVFGETRPNGSAFWYVHPYLVFGECRIKGGADAEEVKEALLKSESAREMLLDTRFHSFGIYLYQRDKISYWVVLFGL